MKALVITHANLEKFSAQEIKELIKVKTSIKPSVVLFDYSKIEQLWKLCYMSQSAIKVLRFIKSFNINDFDNEIKRIDFSFLKNKIFKVKCKRIGEHDFSSIDIASKLGAHIAETYKLKSDMKNPEEIIYVYIYNNDCYVCIDIVNMDLSKREYKIFNHPTSIKGTLAFLMIKASGFNGKGTLVDPFCTSGVIPIEASLYACKFPVRFFSKKYFNFPDRFFEKIDSKIEEKESIYAIDSVHRNIKSAEKNAKIAGVWKCINFSRQNIEWLDTKFKEKEIDYVVTQIPHISKYSRVNEVNKQYREFFYQLEYILNKKAVIFSKANDNIKEFMQGFEIEESIDIQLGENNYILYVIKAK